jgi:hypothetical protein
MREYKLGTFFGEDILVKSDKDFDWVKKWENWLEDEKQQAVQEYKDNLFLLEAEKKSKEMEKTLWFKVVTFLNC